MGKTNRTPYHLRTRTRDAHEDRKGSHRGREALRMMARDMGRN